MNKVNSSRSMAFLLVALVLGGCSAYEKMHRKMTGISKPAVVTKISENSYHVHFRVLEETEVPDRLKQAAKEACGDRRYETSDVDITTVELSHYDIRAKIDCR